MVQDVEVTSWDGGRVRTRDDDGTDCKGTHTAPIVVRHVSSADTQLLKGRAQGGLDPTGRRHIFKREWRRRRDGQD